VTVMLELRATLSAEPEQVAEARRLVAGYLHDAGDNDGDVAVLLVSELVTNAILHGRAPLELRAHSEGSALRVEVADQDPTSPPMLNGDENLTEPGGRGLQLVDTLADRWGWSASDDGSGKVVWFELDA
jgi:anti-sigma regulatory factor (Ser/Thr protein kinase)